MDSIQTLLTQTLLGYLSHSSFPLSPIYLDLGKKETHDDNKLDSACNFRIPKLCRNKRHKKEGQCLTSLFSQHRSTHTSTYACVRCVIKMYKRA
jgi:hypothetical protein